MVICPDCGKEVPKEKFCKNCGAYIENIEEPVKIDAGPVDEIQEESTEESREIVEEPVKIDAGPVDEIQEESIKESGDIVPVSGEVVEKEPVQNQEKAKDNSRFCVNCGFKLAGSYHFCPNCGYDLSHHDSVPKKVAGEKSTILAVILSVILPGLGQIYLGLDNKGAIFLIAYIVSAFLILFVIGLLLVFVIWIWALIDTIISINALNRGDEVVDKLF